MLLNIKYDFLDVCDTTAVVQTMQVSIKIIVIYQL